MARSVLFSQPSVVDFLEANYECAWESVRQVPKVDIDFGNGYRLERTLSGNIATYLCSPDGRTLDVIPGIWDVDGYLTRLVEGVWLHQLAATEGPERVAREFHTRGTELADQPREEAYRGLVGESLILDLSKGRVERDLKTSLAGLHRERIGSILHANEETPEPVAKTDPIGIPNFLKEDALYNAEIRGPFVHSLLSERPGARPAEITHAVFGDVLGIDIDDPYLGLAPYVLGGEIGRHGPEGN